MKVLIKKILIVTPLILIGGYISMLQFKSSHRAVYPISIDSISTEAATLGDSISASIDSLKLLKPEVSKAIKELKYYKNLSKEYESQEANIVLKAVVDSSSLMVLRNKLAAANNEIARLNNVIAAERSARYSVRPNNFITSYTQTEIQTPDDNSIVVSLDGKSKNGELPTTDLTIYLIPYKKSVKRLMNYDSSCNEFSGGVTAEYYNGVYFFNNVPRGKYIIKICTYFGNYKLIEKNEGKYFTTMQVSPPIQ